MRELKILTAVVYVSVAGVAASLAGGIYTGIRAHQEEARPAAFRLPVPATLPGEDAHPAQRPAGGALPVPAR